MGQGAVSGRREVLGLVFLCLLAGVLGGMLFERNARQPLTAQLQPSLDAAVEPTVGPTEDPSQPPPPVSPDDPRTLIPLAGSDVALREAVVAQFVARRDTRIIAPLILLLWAGREGLSPGLTGREVGAMRDLSGQDCGTKWEECLEWWGREHQEPLHPGYGPLQAVFLSQKYPRLGPVMAPRYPSRLPRDGIVWGGRPPELSSPLTHPLAVEAGDPSRGVLTGDDPVVGLVVEGRPRAYPIRILERHETVNDVVGDRAICIAHCSRSGATSAFDATVEGVGRVVFESSGLVSGGTRLLLEEQSPSLWSLFTGIPVLGVRVQAEPPVSLRPIPLVRTDWKSWTTYHPDTTLLSRNTGFLLDYATPVAQASRESSQMDPVPTRSTALPFRTWVAGVTIGTSHRAFPLTLFQERVSHPDRIGGIPVTLVKGDSPLEVRAYQGGEVSLFRGEDGLLTDSAGGGTWIMEEESLRGPGGRTLQRVPLQVCYWFAWYAAFPETRLAGVLEPAEKKGAGRRP